MKIIQSSATLLDEYDDQPIKKVEYIGRTCYKSEDKITEDSAAKFVDKTLGGSSHLAMMEHAWVTYHISCKDSEFRIPAELLLLPNVGYTSKFYASDDCEHYLTVSMSHLYRYGLDVETGCRTGVGVWAAGDLFDRSYLTNELFKAMSNCFVHEYCDGDHVKSHIDAYNIDIEIVPNIVAIHNFSISDYFEHKYLSFKFVCDRGVSHEIVRHRASFGQESTRYCNYSKDKFSNNLTFIEPSTYNEWPEAAQEQYYDTLLKIEETYLSLVSEDKLRPEQARAILPNSLKTEVVMTAPVKQWRHFFDLRYFGTTGAPHPDMKDVAGKAYTQFIEYNRKTLCGFADMDDPLLSKMI